MVKANCQNYQHISHGQQFFHPRRMEAILAAGSKRVDSGPGPLPPLDQHIEQLERGASGSMYGYDDDSYYDDSQSGRGFGGGDSVLNARRRAIEQRKCARGGLVTGLVGGALGSGNSGAQGRYRLFIVGF